MNFFITKIILSNQYFFSPLITKNNQNFHFFQNIFKYSFSNFLISNSINLKIFKKNFYKYLNNLININNISNSLINIASSYTSSILFENCIFGNSTSFETFLSFNSNNGNITLNKCGFISLIGNWVPIYIPSAFWVKFTFLCFEKTECLGNLGFRIGYSNNVKNLFYNYSIEFNCGNQILCQWSPFLGATNFLNYKYINSTLNKVTSARSGICIIESPISYDVVQYCINYKLIGISLIAFYPNNGIIKLSNLLLINNQINSFYFEFGTSPNNPIISNSYFINNTKISFGNNPYGILLLNNCYFDFTQIEFNSLLTNGITFTNLIFNNQNYNIYFEKFNSKICWVRGSYIYEITFRKSNFFLFYLFHYFLI